MTADPPKYRPLERFWPYADLPEQPTDEELAALDPDLHEALFGAPARPFSITLVFPALDVPDFARALELARASAEFRETGSGDGRRYRARFWSSDASQAARSVSDRRPARRHRGAHRRSAGAVRPRAVAAARLVPHSAVACRGPDLRHRTRPAAARSRAEAARRRIQHVLLRPAAEAAVGDARPRRGARQAARSRATSRTTGDRFRFTTLQSRYATFIDLWDRGLRAREEGRPGPFAQQRTAEGARGEARARRIASCTSSSFRDPVREIDKLHRALRIAGGGAARSRRGRGRRSTSSPSS